MQIPDSTNGTFELLEECADRDERIKIIRSSRKNVRYQYNLGTATAQDNYIGFAEPDYYVVQKIFETC